MISRKRFCLLIMSVPLFSSCSLTDPESPPWISLDHPTDEELEKIFYSRQALFEELVSMFEADSKVAQVGFDFALPMENRNRFATDTEFSEIQRNQYHKIFSKLRLKEGISRPINSSIIEMIASSIGDSSKGYTYSKVPLRPLYNSLNSYPLDAKYNQTSYKELEKENWYLFLD